MTAVGATGLVGVLAGCGDAIKKLKPTGQTVAYKTPGGELREGTMTASVSDGSTPESTPVVDSERSVASVGETWGRLSLSPAGDEVAYITLDSSVPEYVIVIQSLSGGRTRYPATDFQQHWDGLNGTFSRGSFLALDWCPASGSDRLAVALYGGSELARRGLFEFTRGSMSMEPFETLNWGPSTRSPGVVWSPSCDEVAFRQGRGGVSETDPLSIVNPGAGSVTVRARNATFPAWGEHGLAFVRNGDVYLDRGSGADQLTTSASTDLDPVIFDQTPGESLAFRRGHDIYLIERIDELGADPNPSPTKILTDRDVATFDIVD